MSALGLAGLTGAVAATRWVGGTTAGFPTSGTFLQGDWVTSIDGNVYICTAAGTPGSWVPAGTPPAGAITPFTGTTDPANGFLCDGRAISRTTYAGAFAISCPVMSATLTSGSPNVTVTSTVSIAPGAKVEGTGIPTNTTVSSITNSTTFVMSANATQSVSENIRILPYGNGDAVTTYNIPDLRTRIAMGSDNFGTSAGAAGRSSSSVVLGQTSGEDTHTLTASESGTTAHSHANFLTDPEHSHTFSGGSGGGQFGLASNSSATGSAGVSSSVPTGITITNVNATAASASSAHNIRQLSLSLYWVYWI